MVTTASQFDKLLELKDAGLIGASAAWQVGGAAKVLDLGSDAQFYGDLVANITAIETATGDEVYHLVLQGSSSPTFASDIQELGRMTVGAATPKAGGATVVDGVGKHVMPVGNERNGVVYRYIRGFTIVAGTIATGINFSAFLTKIRGY